VKENASCRTTVEKILKFFDDVHIMWKTGKDILTPEFAQPRIPHDILFVIEGSRCKDLTACVEVYDVRADLWIMVSSTQVQ
jgi:kelch-like protein 10